MTERFSKWDAAEHLRAHEDARPYMRACADKDPGDGSLIRAALNDVARSGNMAGLEREAGMSREGLYKALSAGGNPTFSISGMGSRSESLSNSHSSKTCSSSARQSSSFAAFAQTPSRAGIRP